MKLNGNLEQLSLPAALNKEARGFLRHCTFFALSVVFGALVSTPVVAQDWKPAVDKWRACGDAAAARYSKSSESAPIVARLAALACYDEKKQATQAVSQVEGSAFADQFIEAAERHYVDRLSVSVMEMRLHGSEKR
jgi:hypothetical protein